VSDGVASPGGNDTGSERPRLWTQALVIFWLLWLYDAINNLSPLRQRTALAHAAAVLRVERVLHINVELSLNLWTRAHPLIGLVLSNFYDSAHFVVTLAVIGWLWYRRPNMYRPLRDVLVLINVIGMAVFWLYPLAPPRMLTTAGFVDVVTASHAVGSWHTGVLASQANEYAAMPSLHIAWAVWSAIGLWMITDRRWVRVVAVLYPALAVVAVMATANHFLMDVLGGGLTVLVAIAAAFYLRRMQAWVKVKMALVGPQSAGRGDNRWLADAVTHPSSTSLDPPLVEGSPRNR
jgi:hypothetical protein